MKKFIVIAVCFTFVSSLAQADYRRGYDNRRSSGNYHYRSGNRSYGNRSYGYRGQRNFYGRSQGPRFSNRSFHNKKCHRERNFNFQLNLGSGRGYQPQGYPSYPAGNPQSEEMDTGYGESGGYEDYDQSTEPRNECQPRQTRCGIAPIQISPIRINPVRINRININRVNIERVNIEPLRIDPVCEEEKQEECPPPPPPVEEEECEPQPCPPPPPVEKVEPKQEEPVKPSYYHRKYKKVEVKREVREIHDYFEK